MKSYFRSRHFKAYHSFRQIWNCYRYVLFFTMGMLAGVLFIFFVTNGKARDNGYAYGFQQWNIYNSSYENAVLHMSFDHMELWRTVMVTRVRDCAILLILGFTRFYETWISLYLLIEGLLLGLLCGMAIASWGGGGILVFLGTLLPHYIIYIVAVILLIRFFQNKNYQFKNTATMIGFMILLLVVATFAEAFINPYIQKWILYQVSNLV